VLSLVSPIDKESVVQSGVAWEELLLDQQRLGCLSADILDTETAVLKAALVQHEREKERRRRHSIIDSLSAEEFDKLLSVPRKRCTDDKEHGRELKRYKPDFDVSDNETPMIDLSVHDQIP